MYLWAHTWPDKALLSGVVKLAIFLSFFKKDDSFTTSDAATC